MKFIEESYFGFEQSEKTLFDTFELKNNIDIQNKMVNKYLKINNEDILTNELNSYFFRSDEFKKTHNGLHVVFSGCSNTWGTGIYKEELWSYKTYKLISENKECSGYFNLGSIGTGSASIIINLFKYFKKYGNPNVIFINFPDSLRFFSYDKLNEKYFDAFYNKDSKKILDLINFNHYFMLEQYCKSNNIQLYSFSWVQAKQKFLFDHEAIEVPFNSFETYYTIKSKDIYESLDNDKKIYEDPRYLEFARDRMHPGISFHDYWSNFIYDKYIKNQ